MIDFSGKKYYKVFDLRTMNPDNDPGKIMSEEFLFRAALNYDPANIHEAVFWADHYDEGKAEPRTGGYINSVIAIGPEFFVSFSEILPWMQYLYEAKEFKRCSAEFVLLNHKGEKLPYFYAMCPTNAPGSRGLPPLELAIESGDQTDHKFAASDMIETRLTFTETEFETKIFKSKNIPTMQNPNLVSLAKNQGVKVTDEMTDAQIQTALDAKFTELKSTASRSEADLAAERHEKAVALIDAAVETGKLSPEGDESFAERKEALTKFAEVDYEGAKKVISGFEKKTALTDDSKVATSKVELKSSGGKDSPAGAVTFDDVIGNPEKYIGRFTDAELEKMHKEDPRWKGITLGEEREKSKL